MQFRSIVCATDFSEHSNRTIPYGVAIAREFGATLYLCHVIDLTALTIYGEFQIDPVGQQTRIRQEANEQLEKMLGPHRIQWEPLIAVGHRRRKSPARRKKGDRPRRFGDQGSPV
jgi:nucleotide-binding universal stress UspA family protein